MSSADRWFYDSAADPPIFAFLMFFVERQGYQMLTAGKPIAKPVRLSHTAAVLLYHTAGGPFIAHVRLCVFGLNRGPRQAQTVGSTMARQVS